MWSGDITWRDRGDPTRPDTAKIVGSPSGTGEKINFQYNWEDIEYFADFDIKTGVGKVRRAGSSEIHATFAGVFRLSDDQIEMRGGVWTEDGRDYDWEADLGDY
jgi:hypothetical protein